MCVVFQPNLLDVNVFFKSVRYFKLSIPLIEPPGGISDYLQTVILASTKGSPNILSGQSLSRINLLRYLSELSWLLPPATTQRNGRKQNGTCRRSLTSVCKYLFGTVKLIDEPRLSTPTQKEKYVRICLYLRCVCWIEESHFLCGNVIETKFCTIIIPIITKKILDMRTFEAIFLFRGKDTSGIRSISLPRFTVTKTLIKL